VSGWRPIPGHQAEPHGFLVNGSDGSVRDVSQAIPYGTFQIASDSGHWFMLFSSGSSYFSQILDTEFAAVGSWHELPFNTSAQPHVTPGGDQFLVHSAEGAVRVSNQDGTLFDQTVIEFSRYNHGETRAVYRNGTYQLVWGKDKDLFGSRIRATDGVVLDPDDTFNQISGARLLCGNCAQTVGYGQVVGWAIADAGDSALVTWAHTSASNDAFPLLGARIDVASGSRAEGSTSAPEFRLGTLNWYAHDLHLAAGWGALLTYDSVASVTYDSGQHHMTLNPKKAVAFGSETRNDVAVAYGGGQFLTSWRVGNATYATRVNASTGAYLDSPPIALGTGNPPVLGWTGTAFLVASLDGQNIQRRLILPNGQLGAQMSPIAIGVPSSDVVTNSLLRLVHNGSYLLASWHRQSTFSGSGIRALRLDSGAVPVDADPIVLTSTVSWDYVLLADTFPPADRKTFLLAYQSDGRVFSRRLRSASGAVIEPVIDLGPGYDIYGASDGSSLLLDYVKGSRQAAGFVDATAGTWLNEPTTFDWWTVSLGTRQTWFDGASYVLLTQTAAEQGIRRLDASLLPLEPAAPLRGLLAVQNQGAPYILAAASNGSGKSLLVDCEPDPVRLGIATKGRWLVNDGEPGAGGEGGQGGASTGGVSTGGTPTGGASAAGEGAGGANTGGTRAGGASAGGANTAGASVGGEDTDGGASGGARGGEGGRGNVTGGTNGESGGVGGDAAEGGNLDGGRSTGGRASSGGSGASANGGRAGSGGAGTAGTAAAAAAGNQAAPADGCNCRQTRSGGTPNPLWSFVLVALVYLRRERRGRGDLRGNRTGSGKRPHLRRVVLGAPR
jgi:hypothetical protein